MSAPDFTARALALRAAAHNPLSFAELAQARLPGTISRIHSSGHTAPGQGPASYVCDAKATAALAAAHPLAVFAGADGRYFRLAGDADGYITPEQLGCGVYAAGTNQQPMIQAALNYCKAAGLQGVKFPQPKYELWVPARTGSYTSTTDHSGCFLVIDGWSASLVGCDGNKTTLHCKGPTGGSLESDFQVMNSATYGGDVIWRGHGIKLTGTISNGAARPDEGNLANLTVRDIRLLSDAVGTQNTAWPATPASRDPSRVNCWDITNKGFYFQQGVHIGNLTLENVEVIGFLGECIFTPDRGNSKVVGRNLVLKHTNGQALNPNGPEVLDIDGLYAENCAFTIEGWAGQGYGRIVNAHFKDSVKGGVTGSRGYDNLRADSSIPWLYLDILLENCGDFYVGAFTQGRIRAIDTQLAVVGVNSIQTICNTVLDVTVIAHKKNVGNAIRFAPVAARSLTGVSGDGASVTYTTSGTHGFTAGIPVVVQGCTPSGYNGTFTITAATGTTFTVTNTATGTLSVAGNVQPSQSIRNNSFKIECMRSDYAIANGFVVQALMTQSGSIGSKNFVYAKGEVNAIGSVTAPLDNYVALIDEGLNLSTGGAPMLYDPSTTSSPDMGMGWMRAGTFSVGNGIYTTNLPATGMYQHGAEIVIEHRDSGKTACFVELAEGGAKRGLLGYKDAIKFRCNKLYGRWDLVRSPPARSAAASINIASTALGAESGPYTIPATGCRAWHSAEVLPPAPVTGFAVSAVRAETDQVRFWVRNVDGANPEDPAAATFTARWAVLPS